MASHQIPLTRSLGRSAAYSLGSHRDQRRVTTRWWELSLIRRDSDRSSANILAVDGECSGPKAGPDSPQRRGAWRCYLDVSRIAHVGAHEHDGPARFESAGQSI